MLCLLLFACSESPPAEFAPLTAWAHDTDVKLSPAHDCDGVEVQQFGARSATCWFAKSRHEQTPGSRMFPRFDITLADYGSDDKARARLADLHRIPTGGAEMYKAYPLRAAFRLGSRVMFVATDAYAFEPEVERAARELAAAAHGSDLTCWMPCTP